MSKSSWVSIPKRACVHCGEVYFPKRIVQRWCSLTCRANAKRAAYAAKNPNAGLPTGTVGAISELKVGADLLGKGFEVFRALSPSCSCDLAILRDGRLVRVEVTTGHRSSTGRVIHPSKINRYDLLAVVLSDGTIHYDPEP